MVTALTAPDFDNPESWADEHGMQGRDWAAKNKRIHDRFDRIVEDKNEGLDHAEKVKKHRLVSDK